MGSCSAIFWTLFFQTTLKYVFITLRADNNGEGGIFSLYALIRKKAKWLFFPAILGGSFLLADTIISPPISVSSAIEGILPLYPDLPIIPIVLGILLFLFIIQQFGTAFIGKMFGPLMVIWFFMIAFLGLKGIVGNPSVLVAFNPYYVYQFIAHYPGGFWLLGGVFLCTTGAEALYSDLGHCGRKNIQVSWLFVKICLVLCYFGQAAWLIQYQGQVLGNINPFFSLVPEGFLLSAIVVSTFATIIASQALISGTFTLVSEAMRLNLWPKMQVVFPSEVRGQLYIPAINWLLMGGCFAVVLYFKESEYMEAAFGLSVILTMIMTTVLLTFYLYATKMSRWLVFSMFAIFITIELSFLSANLLKFANGGWVTLLLGFVIFSIMFIWNRATAVKKRLQRFVSLKNNLPLLKELSSDTTIPKYATHLVYLTSSEDLHKIEESTIYSIFNKQPKRADIYWFVHIDVVDDPYTMSYKVTILEKDDVIWVRFKLGFRIAPRVNLLFRKVVEELILTKEVNIQSRYHSLSKHHFQGDFRFVVMERFLSQDNELTFRDKFILSAYFMLRKIGISEPKEYGLDYSNLTVEKTPLVIKQPKGYNLVREF